MNGRELYAMYERVAERFNITVDPWEALSYEDCQIWNQLAEEVAK